VEAYREDIKEIKSGQAGLRSVVNTWLTDIKNDRKETMACQDNTEARLEVEDKPDSEDRTPEVAHKQEFPSKDAEDIPVGEPRKRRRDRRNLSAVRRQKEQDQNLDARRRRKEQKRAQRKDGCRRNFVAARRGATRRAAVARHRILLTKDTTRELRESPKDLTVTGRKETRRAKVARHKENFVGKTGARKSPSRETTPGTRLSEGPEYYGRSGREGQQTCHMAV
jgi:hypothetical protein